MEVVSEEELMGVLSSFQKDNIPSLDGFLVYFFLVLFDTIGDNILRVVVDSRAIGRIHYPFNSTFISIIPKVDSLASFDDFRPIFIYNHIYKIIVRVVAHRLKPLLSNAISGEHFTFSKRIQIREAICVA